MNHRPLASETDPEGVFRVAEKIVTENEMHDDDLSRVETSATTPSTRSTAQSANGLSAPPPGPWRVIVKPHKEVEANARLIAAAPDLLIALKALVVYYRFTKGPSADDLDAAEAVIDKAEGVR